jgi:hypothetical protein
MSIYNSGNKISTYSPLWSTNDLNLPRDRATINAWARSFYAINPDVHRLINQHALLLKSFFNVKKCKSIKMNKLFEDQLEKLNIPEILDQIIIEYLILGEVFLYTEMDEQAGMFSRLTIQNPDYVLLKKTITDSVDKFYLRPDENLRRICFSTEPKDIAIRNLLSNDVVNTIKNGENILLDNFYLTYFCHKMSPYEMRGTSFLLPLFEILSKEQCNINSQIIKQLLFDITSYDNNSIALNVLMTNYSTIIDRLENWINNKIMKPMYKIQGLDGEFPKIKFDKNKLKKDITSSFQI